MPRNGSLLLAEPFMKDPHFSRSVVLLCEHQSEGTVGFILNKPLNIPVDELIADFPQFKAEIYYGGPVATDTIHYVHKLGNILKDSIPIKDGVFWGGDYEKLKFLIDAKQVNADQIRFFVGYSGWTEGQLSDELDYGSWLEADMKSSNVFVDDPKDLWELVMEQKGHTFSVLSQLPDPICEN